MLELNYPLDEVVYFDIGAELGSIRSNAEKMKKILLEKGIPFTVLRPKEPFLWCMTEKPVVKRDGSLQCGYQWCGGCARWGTTLKLDAIRENNKKYGGEMIAEYVSFSAGGMAGVKRITG